jgi:hypothetical protein
MQINEEKELSIKEFFDIAKAGGTYEIETPQGWQEIGELFIKEQKPCYEVITEMGKKLKGSKDHYINTNFEWVNLEELDLKNTIVNTIDGKEKITSKENIGIHDTYDLEVLSNEHAYYSNGIESHNTGKTSLLKDFKNVPIEYKNKKYDGFEIVDVPLAQIEEMGDVLGVPEDFILMTKVVIDEVTKKETIEEEWVLAKEVIIEQKIKFGWTFENGGGKTVTKYAPPDWVPTEERPGLIIFDDGNRATERIAKGFMQLVQDYRTISWSIPKGWTILFTGNPDNHMFMVSQQDSAMKTRMRHITMEFDAQEWAEWATKSNLDPRGINYMLKYGYEFMLNYHAAMGKVYIQNGILSPTMKLRL